MTTLTYNLTRQQAADMLGVSTRTVDRYVKGGKLSYKKVANKVILATEELEQLQDEFSLLHQEPQPSTVVNEQAQVPSSGLQVNKVSKPVGATSLTGVKEFVDLLQDKDNTIEEKNQIIFALQHKLGELETRLQQMIALPDHTQEKEKLVHNIQKLELERQELMRTVKSEKTWNAVYIGLVLVAAATIMFFALGL